MPSAQLFIDSRGRFDRCIDVEIIQCGRPRKTTTAQNAKRIARRPHACVGGSGGSSDTTPFDDPPKGDAFAPRLSLAAGKLIWLVDLLHTLVICYDLLDVVLRSQNVSSDF